MNCTACGRQIQAGVIYCPNCGTPTPAYYAPTVASSSSNVPPPPPYTNYGSQPYGMPSPYSTPPPAPYNTPPPASSQGSSSTATPTVAPAQATAAAQAHTTATASTALTATAQAQATATASVIAANPNPYTPGSGKLALIDPLSDNSKGYAWDVGSYADGACAFSGGPFMRAHRKSISSTPVLRKPPTLATSLLRYT
jgi:hypothetical protein